MAQDHRGEPRPNDHSEERRTFTATQARQGRWGRRTFTVLVVSILLALVAWAAAELWGESGDPQEPSAVVRQQVQNDGAT